MKTIFSLGIVAIIATGFVLDSYFSPVTVRQFSRARDIASVEDLIKASDLIVQGTFAGSEGFDFLYPDEPTHEELAEINTRTDNFSMDDFMDNHKLPIENHSVFVRSLLHNGTKQPDSNFLSQTISIFTYGDQEARTIIGEGSYPDFKAGDKVVLFLKQFTDQNEVLQDRYVIVNMDFGLFWDKAGKLSRPTELENIPTINAWTHGTELSVTDIREVVSNN